MEKKYSRQIRPKIPFYSLQQADHHNQQLSMFDQQQAAAPHNELDALPFMDEISKYANNDQLQYEFDPVSGLWRK